MPQFILQVQGKFIVEAEDKDAAKEIATGHLAEKAPWLKLAYGEPERLASMDDVFASYVDGKLHV